MPGRPKFRQDMALLEDLPDDMIISMLEVGKSQTQICYELGIGRRALEQWIEDTDPTIIARARAKAADQLAVETLAIADSMADSNPQRDVQRIRTRQWLAERWAKSAQDADLLLIADTGSTDDTVAIAKENGVVVHEICVTPWRFDHARNASLALIPKDYDVCICLDADEVMEPGWREELERVWIPGVTTHLRYKFDWSAGIVFYSEKIHARHGYYWHHPCHEHIRADLRIEEVWAHTDTLLISHHPDPGKSRGHYMETLELSVKEDPYCPRNAFYYARELFFYCRWQEAIEALTKYLAMPNATWVNDRCYAMRLIGQCHAALGAQGEAEAWYHKAAAEAPHTREPWVALAKLYYEQHKWAECYGAATRALSITNKELFYTTEPASWGYLPHDFAAIAAFHLGLKQEAMVHGQDALNLEPNDPRLAENMRWYQGEVA